MSEINNSRIYGMVLLFCILFFTGDRVLASLGTWALKFSTMPDAELYTQRGKADIIILGNSRAYHHFPEKSWSEATGKKVRVYAIEAASMEYMEAVLFDYIDRYGNPERIIIEPSCLTWGNDMVQNLKVFAAKSERLDILLKENYPEDYWASRFFHLYRLNTTGYLNILHKIIVPYQQPLLAGQISESELDKVSHIKEDTYFRNKPPNIESLKRTIQMLSEKGVPVDIIVTPVVDKIFSSEQHVSHWVEEIREIIGTQTGFYDFSGEIKDSELFKDRTHLNQKGVKRLFQDIKQSGYFEQVMDV